MEIELDMLDRKILEYLQVDSRRPFLEIARNLKISGGTVHGRVNRMKEIGIIRGSKVIIDYRIIGLNISAFVGIQLSEARHTEAVQAALTEIPEIVEIHCTTGAYNFFVKTVTSSVEALYALLTDKLQPIEFIRSTETLLVLHTPLIRDPDIAPPATAGD